MTLTQRVALVVGALFLVLAAWAAFVPSHSHGDSCGIWADPKLTDEGVAQTLQDAQDVIDTTGGLVDTSRLRAITVALADEKRDCDSKLDTRQTLTWVGVAGLVLGPLAVLFIGGEFGRRREDA